MVEDALARLKNRQRAAVPTRDSSVLSSGEMTSFNNDVITERRNSVKPPMNTQLVRSTIRLNAELDSQMDQLCLQHKITKETFLEAAFSLASIDEELMGTLVQQAKHRRRLRLQESEFKKLATLQLKLASKTPESD